MAGAVSDAAQTTMSAMTNGHTRQSRHSNRNGYSGTHGERPSPAASTNGDSTARPDKGKEPEHLPQAMDIDEPSTTPADTDTGLVFPSSLRHGCRSSDYGVSPEQVSQMMANMDEPEEEDWDTIEENWNLQMAEIYKKEDDALFKSYQAEEDVMVDQLEKAIAVHNRVLQDLFQARVEVDGKVDALQCLLAKHQELQKTMEDGRDATNLRVRSWIGNGRKAVAEAAARRRASHNHPLADDDDDRSTSVFNERLHGLVEHSDQNRNSRSSSSRRRLSQRPTSADGEQGPNGDRAQFQIQSWDGTHPGFLSHKVTDVVSATTGARIGTLRSIPLINHWIESLMHFTVLRPVEIRLGRKFTLAHLEAIYQGPDQKQSKWLSFMIQATGQQQERACQTCAKGQGLFSMCIIVGGPDFPRCGNCEWNKHGCHGASGNTNTVLPDFHGQARSQNRPRPDGVDRNKMTKLTKTVLGTKPHINYKKSVAHFTKAMNLQDPPKPPPPNQADDDNEQSSLSPTSDRKRGQSLKTAKSGSARGGRRQKSTGDSTSGNNRPSTPENGDHSFSKAMSPFDATEEITQDTLSLRHDGMIYLEPELMYGVPRRKISPEHAYWDPSWKSLETYVTNRYNEWKSKLNTLKNIPDADLTDKDRTAIFQAGRQINRGTAILKYLANCDSHPYQLVSKSFLTASSTHYDTLFRMVATIDELGKFRLSVSPVDWLRQRLYEIHREKGDAFKLDKVLGKLYNDPKLSYLRSKNGFGNIGRPSVLLKGGIGGVEGSGGDGTGQSSGTKGRSDKRRQRQESAASTPTRRAFTDAEKQAARNRAPRNNRQKTAVDAAAASAALGPASVTASAHIASRSTKNSSQENALDAVASPERSGSVESDQDSVLSTPVSSRAMSRSGSVAADDGGAGRNAGELDGQEESMDESHNTSRSSDATDSQIETIEGHHISHNHGEYTDSDGDETDSDGSHVHTRGRNRTRNSARNNSRNAHIGRRSRVGRTSRSTANEELDLDYSGYTSRDSFTNDVVVKKDWRVLQVKTRDLTSNRRTTQYWHWVDEQHAHQMSGPAGPADFDPMFEHQVLKEKEPTTSWGVFREPINFHLRLRELTGIRYAPGSTVIVIGTSAMADFPHRGDVLAEFKRERTKRRFLVFMKKKGVPLHKVPRDEIAEAWDSLSSSELMPGSESD